MRRRFGPSLYFASDKVIFDALNQRAVSIELLRDLLRERGILVSHETPKEELARYFSRLTADFFDHKSIAVRLGRITKKERMTSFEIRSDVSHGQVLTSVNELKTAIEEHGDTAHVEASGKSITLHIAYEEIDYTKVELRQVQPRDAVIELVPDGSGAYLVRSSDNSYTAAAVERLCKSLTTQLGGTLDRRSITLQGHADHRLRTEFFERLMRSVPGYVFVTVTEAYCYKPRKSVEIEGAEDNDDGDRDLEDQPFVEKVGLRGEGVDRTFVIGDLFKNSYYVVKTVWRVRSEASLDADYYELEAQFSDPAACAALSYQARNVLIREAGRLTTKKRSPKRDEQDALFRAMEEAAKAAFAAVTALGAGRA